MSIQKAKLGYSRNKSRWGYTTKDGKEVVAFNYDYANSFISGIAQVRKNGKSIDINKSSKETD